MRSPVFPSLAMLSDWPGQLVRVLTGYGPSDRALDFQRATGYFPFPPHPDLLWGPLAFHPVGTVPLSLGVLLKERDASYPSASTVGVKNRSFHSIPHTIPLRDS